jgi:hypothetical protein
MLRQRACRSSSIAEVCALNPELLSASMAIRLTPPPPRIPHTFFVGSPGALFSKLHWELDELKARLAPNENPLEATLVYYTAFNFAVTAWHLTDWVARSLDDAELVYRHGELMGPNADDISELNGDEKRRAFTKALLAAHLNLRICHDLANGDKHAGHLTRPKVVKLSTKVHHNMVADENGEYKTHFSLTVTEDDREMDGVAFFKDVICTWRCLLGPWGLIEGHMLDVEDGKDEFGDAIT